VGVQFGRWNIDKEPTDMELLTRAEKMLAPFGPDGISSYINDNLGVLYFAFHTNEESRSERQPHLSASGALLTWDGRLDNRSDLIRELSAVCSPAVSDAEIVAAAYEAWGTACFAKIIGDWALSIWEPRDQSLILAKDPIGTRHLYYSFNRRQISWCTVLDALVCLDQKRPALDEEYIAGWLSSFPAADLTPYIGIRAVRPSCFVQLDGKGEIIRKYWDFDPSRRTRYRADTDYEEAFRHHFGEAVRRRLRSDRSILAELSGGMDSSAIVCMADSLMSKGTWQTSLDTISYYDDSEPNWDDRVYFERVEAQRGRVGCHIDFASHEGFEVPAESHSFSAIPDCSGMPLAVRKEISACMTSQGNRVLLSGIGGDEFTGAVPTPVPELQDELAGFRLRAFCLQLKRWALNKRKPWFYLFFEAVSGFLPSRAFGLSKGIPPAPWLNPQFVRQHQEATAGYPSRIRVRGPRPSFQHHLSTIEALRRQFACEARSATPCHEVNYPFLDRDFLEWIFSVPVNQLTRPGHRRSLMRRALVGIVPDEVLNRRRKAFSSRAPRASVLASWTHLVERYPKIITDLSNIIDTTILQEMIRDLRNDSQIPIVKLVRTLILISWLQGIDRFSPIASATVHGQDFALPNHDAVRVAALKSSAS
jgi:asparagine synthase (glutamine-hydrolysing)